MRHCLAKISSVVFILGLVTMYPTPGVGSLVASLNNQGSTTLHEITVNPGDLFDADIVLAADGPVHSVGMRLEASVSDVVDIIAAEYHNPWDVYYLAVPPQGVDPVSSQFGAALASFSPAPVSSPLLTLGFLVDFSVLPGTYKLNVTEVYYTESPAIPESVRGSAGDGFVVHVLPEPTSATLVVLLFTVTQLRRR